VVAVAYPTRAALENPEFPGKDKNTFTQVLFKPAQSTEPQAPIYVLLNGYGREISKRPVAEPVAFIANDPDATTSLPILIAVPLLDMYVTPVDTPLKDIPGTQVVVSL
jgi:hypothetical protein